VIVDRRCVDIFGYVIAGWVLLSFPATAVAAVLFRGAALGAQPVMRLGLAPGASRALVHREQVSA
jgi:hypothetical protein